MDAFTNPLIMFLGGLLIGSAITLLITFFARKILQQQILQTSEGIFRRLALKLFQTSNQDFLRLAEERFQRQTQLHESTLKSATQEFKSKNQQLLQIAEARIVHHTQQHDNALDAKTRLIDNQLHNVESRLQGVVNLMSEIEQRQTMQLSELNKELKDLSQISAIIQRAIADNRIRGHWGEKIAEDIIRACGLVEGLNYTKQVIDEHTRRRPDFTFSLPNGLMLNMDAKFPLNNYLKYHDAAAATDKDQYAKTFIKDVRNRIKEVVGREYINPEQNTVDAVLVFIPNEALFRFILEEDNDILSDALEQRVILCSPLTLYAVLSVFRQASDNFRLQQASRDILKHFTQFKKHWTSYTKDMKTLGDNLERAQAAFASISGKRQHALDRQLQQIELLSSQATLVDLQDATQNVPIEIENISSDFHETPQDAT